MPEAEARTVAQMRARRDEVEGILRANGWKIARQGARFFQWNRRDSEPLWTPVGEPRLDTAEEWASLLDQAAAIAVKPIDPVPSPAPKESGGVGATPSAEAVEEFLTAPKVHAPHDAARDWASLSGRWGQQHSAPLPEGLAGLGARGQEPIAPGPTLAEVQAENQQLRTLHSEAVAAREEAKRQRDEALAAAERERVQANEWLSQLHGARGHKEAVRHSLFGALGMEPDDDHSTLWLLSTIRGQLVALKESNTGIAQELADVDWTLNALGASGTGPAKERLLQVLPRHRVADLRTVELAEAKASIARIRCRNPGIDSSEEPLKSAYAREAAADVALHEILDQMEAAKGRDHVPDAGKKVNG